MMRVFYRNEDNSIGAFDVDADTFSEAIDLVKKETGAERALVGMNCGKKDEETNEPKQ